ncbi:MAG: hypothetical protein KGY80_07890 [Candidatus Thorarchaeota archaeon]|nr:hypothetical protein [Candidatus Thorarchaeota archaeon]
MFTSSVMGHLCGGDKAEVGDHDHPVVRTVENFTVAGVMYRGMTGDRSRDHRRNPIPVNVDKALAWPGVAPWYSGDTGQGKGGTQELQPVPKTVRNGLSKKHIVQIEQNESDLLQKSM